MIHSLDNIKYIITVPKSLQFKEHQVKKKPTNKGPFNQPFLYIVESIRMIEKPVHIENKKECIDTKN